MHRQTIYNSLNQGLKLLKQWDWRLFLLILLYMALPQFYRSYSVYLIGNAIPDTNALATVAQWQFIELLLEVVQETFVLAIFFFVGKGIQSKEGPGYSMRTSLTTIFLFSTVIAAALFSFASQFVSIIGTPEEIEATTATFLKIKTASIPILLMSTASVMIIETINRKKLILALAVLRWSIGSFLIMLFMADIYFHLTLVFLESPGLI